MAALQLLENFVDGKVDKESILEFLSTDNCQKICDKLELCSTVTSTEFIYELIAFLREQSYNVIGNAPKVSTALCSPRKSRTIPNKPKGGPRNTDPKSNRILPSPVTAVAKTPDFSSTSFKDDFPALGAPVTPIKRCMLTSSAGVSHSTPVQAKGNLEVATPPLAAEGIFNRTVPRTEKKNKKRIELTLSPASPVSANQKKTEETPKKRGTLVPVKRWVQESKDSFITTEVSHSPTEVTKQLREGITTMNQESATIQLEEFDKPLLTNVTSKEKLDRLADLYSVCLVSNFVPNLALEMSFVMQLLVVKLRALFSRTAILLGTASNCSYFAVQVLVRCGSLLQIFDPSVLTLLKNLPHVQEMSVDLHLRLCDLCNLERSFSLFRSSFIQGVSFDATVDNSENFPTQRHFGAFRKQRDAFYDLLKDWQRLPFESRNREVAFPNRVRSIFELSMDPCNLLHLSKLFVLQMIATCCGNLETDEQGNTSASMLHDLRMKKPDKLNKLENRLEKPQSAIVSSKYEFGGQQMFFHNFIIHANNAQFHEHLKNVIIGHILDEDKYDFNPEDADTSIDSQIREEICTLLYRLRLYGAFLGLLEFLPYNETSTETTPQVIETQKRIRGNISCKIDLDQCLQNALQERKLLPTLGWISTFLSLADPIAGQLPVYQRTLDTLACIFRSCTSRRAYFVMLRIVVGSIFENMQVHIEFSGPTVDLSTPPEIEAFVDVQLIYMMCPYLTNLRSIVVDFYCFSLSENRKNVPRTTAIKEESGVLGKLEEAFFFVHPSSVKKTVMFVSERVPANAVKLLRPTLIKDIRDDVRKTLLEMQQQEESLDNKRLKTLAQNLCSRSQLKAQRIISPACESQASKLLDELLKADCNSEGLIIAKKICYRQCELRVTQWIRSYISKDYFTKEIKEEMKTIKADTSCVPTADEIFENRPAEGHYSCASVADVIDSLEHLLAMCLSSDLPNTWRDSLDKTRLSLRHRREWKSASWAAVMQILVDLGSLSIVRSVSLETVRVIIDILIENKCTTKFGVDTVRNAHLVDIFSQKDRTLARKLLTDYQSMLDRLTDADQASS